MRQLIAGNWKMNGLTAAAAALAQGVRDGAAGIAAELLVFPPATQLAAVARLLAGSPVAVGGQDCHAEAEGGAFTGDVSAAMLADVGATWVILGHSERRQGHHETDETVREKVLAAQAAGLRQIVCIGETDEQRQAGRETEVVGWQISGSLPKDFAGVVAYEPIWAIGTGRSCGVADVTMMHAFIREELTRQFGAEQGRAVRILYGGSVKPDNAAAILAQAEVGGVLVGGASLEAASFLAIARAAPGASDQAGSVAARVWGG
jgi:triosephosphate isomerase